MSEGRTGSLRILDVLHLFICITNIVFILTVLFKGFLDTLSSSSNNEECENKHAHYFHAQNDEKHNLAFMIMSRICLIIIICQACELSPNQHIVENRNSHAQCAN